MKIILSGMPRRKEQTKIKPTWNLGRPGGWDTYERLTNEAADIVRAIAADINEDINTKKNRVEKIEKKIKFIAFGKTKPSTKKFQDSKKGKNCQVLRCNSGPEASPIASEYKCRSCRT